MAAASINVLVQSPLPVSLANGKAPSSAASTPLPVNAGSSTSMMGDKHLARIAGPSSTTAPQQSSDSDDSTLNKLAGNAVSDLNDLVNAGETADPSDQGYQAKMFDLFAKVLADIALIMQYMSKNMGLQSNISDDSIAVSKQTAQIIQKKLDDMKAEQEKMSGIANILKIVGIIVIVLSVLTCNPEEAPVSTAITVAMTAIVASGGFDQNGYMTQTFIQPLSDAMQNSGMSKNLADFLSKLIVILVMVLAGSAAGAGADSQIVGKAAADDAAGAAAAGGNGAAGDAAAEAAEGGQFLNRLAGNAKQLAAQGITSSNMFNDLLQSFGMDKQTAMILSSIINAAFSFGLNYSAGKDLAPVNFKSTGSAASLIKAGASAGLIVGQTVQSTFTIQEAKVLQEQAALTEALGNATAVYSLVNAWVQMNSSQLKTTNSALQQAGDQLQFEVKSIESITTPGQAAIRALSETRF